MPITRRLEEYLDGHGVKYIMLRHSVAYTAQELAATLHVSGRELAKSVIVKVDGEFVMVVLPASSRIDFERLGEVLGNKKIKLATEEEFADLFPGCEVGAMPPLGNLYGLPVYVAQSLTLDDEIVFNAGYHATAVRMKYADYARLVQPTVFSFIEQVH